MKMSSPATPMGNQLRQLATLASPIAPRHLFLAILRVAGLLALNISREGPQA